MVRDGRTTIMDLEVGAPGSKIAYFYKRFEGNTADSTDKPEALRGPIGWRQIRQPLCITLSQ